MPRRRAEKPAMLIAVKGAASILIPAEMLEKYAGMGYAVYPVERRDANDTGGAAAENEGDAAE